MVKIFGIFLILVVILVIELLTVFFLLFYEVLSPNLALVVLVIASAVIGLLGILTLKKAEL